MAVSNILVCSRFVNGECQLQEYVQGYVLPASASDQLDLLFQGGFSPKGFALGFGGMLSLFAVGMSVGIVISVLRKLKR